MNRSVSLPGAEAPVTQQVFLPTRRRRLVLLTVTALMGATLGYLLPDLAAWANGIVLVGVLALMAGISGLWSP